LIAFSKSYARKQKWLLPGEDCSAHIVMYCFSVSCLIHDVWYVVLNVCCQMHSSACYIVSHVSVIRNMCSGSFHSIHCSSWCLVS